MILGGVPNEAHCTERCKAICRNMQNIVAFLLIEDNEDDVALIKRAFARNKIFNPLQVVKNGNEALLYLQGAGRYRNRDEFPLPKIILLDLKMPGVDGFEVLGWIRQQPELKTMRVIVLTSSNAIQDVNR